MLCEEIEMKKEGWRDRESERKIGSVRRKKIREIELK